MLLESPVPVSLLACAGVQPDWHVDWVRLQPSSWAEKGLNSWIRAQTASPVPAEGVLLSLLQSCCYRCMGISSPVSSCRSMLDDCRTKKAAPNLYDTLPHIWEGPPITPPLVIEATLKALLSLDESMSLGLKITYWFYTGVKWILTEWVALLSANVSTHSKTRQSHEPPHVFQQMFNDVK